jgi:hypothetical protein
MQRTLELVPICASIDLNNLDVVQTTRGGGGKGKPGWEESGESRTLGLGRR